MQTISATDNIHALTLALRMLLNRTALNLRCTVKDGRLIIVGQHQEEVFIDPKQIFSFLEGLIRALPLEFISQVRLYLRVDGQHQPYAQRYFYVNPSPRSLPSQEAAIEWRLSDESTEGWVQELTVAHEPIEATILDVEPAFEPITAEDLESVEVKSSPDNDWYERRLHDRFAAIAGVAAIGLVSSSYILTRPCVVGTCEELSSAASLHATSVQQARQASDRSGLEASQNRLNQAIATLETIPDWSKYGSQSNSLQYRYQVEGLALQQLMDIYDRAAKATQKSQNPRSGQTDWLEIQSLWKSAVGMLEKIPSDSSYYAIAQRQLPFYRSTLEEVDRRLQQEQQAEQLLEEIKQSLQAATMQERLAQTPDQWQQIRQTWVAALEQLQQIPANTAAAIPAQRLRVSYEQRLQQVTRRLEQEQVATEAIARAVNQSRIAQAAEKQSDWRSATAAWDEALKTLYQMPRGTAQQSRAESMAIAYQNALLMARQNVQSDGSVIAELYRVCTNQIHACTPTEFQNTIRVQLTLPYMQMVNAPRTVGTAAADHENTLKQAFQAVANKADRTIEVYTPDGRSVATYSPQAQ